MTLNDIRNAVKVQKPLIHCITNPISINQCANTVLSVGAQPIMAEHPLEVSDITKTAQALVLNLGNITDVRLKSIAISAKTANENNIPYVLDLVGISCSQLRRDFARALINETRPTVIKGNYSEINALYNKYYTSKGVDAENLDTDYIEKISLSLAKEYNAIILASGKTDVITDGVKLYHINNGTPELAQITGTGCMLGMLCGCYLSACHDIRATVTACAVLGISGELSQTDKGTGSFFVNLMDKLSTLSEEEFDNYIKLEEKEFENT